MSKQIERAVEKNIRDADVDIIGERRRAVRGMEGGSGWVVGVEGEGREKGGRGGGMVEGRGRGER